MCTRAEGVGIEAAGLASTELPWAVCLCGKLRLVGLWMLSHLASCQKYYVWALVASTLRSLTICSKNSTAPPTARSGNTQVGVMRGDMNALELNLFSRWSPFRSWDLQGSSSAVGDDLAFLSRCRAGQSFYAEMLNRILGPRLKFSAADARS